MRFGDYECFAIELGEFWVDGGAMFGTVPKVQWQEKTEVDALNRIRLKNRSLLIKGNNRIILVDTGCGDKFADAKESESLGVLQPGMDINLLLSGFELDCYQITDVILTHLHYDHAGGATKIVQSAIEPTYPNARYWVQSEQWEQACNPHERDMGSFIPADFRPLMEAGQLELVDGSITLCDGLELMVTYGHTMAQQHVLVHDPVQPLFFCADLIPTVAHVPVSWHMAYDNKPLDLFPEKDYFLRKAIRENWLLFFEHDPDIAAATVKEGGRWVVLDQKVAL